MKEFYIEEKLKVKYEEKRQQDFLLFERIEKWKYDNKWSYSPSDDGKNYLHETGVKTNFDGILGLYYGRVHITNHPITNANSSSEGL